MEYGRTAYNRIVCIAPPYGGLACEKPQSALRAFTTGTSVRFFSGTFGAGVNVAHCPITRPKRRIQPERYTTWGLKFVLIFSKKYSRRLDEMPILKYTVFTYFGGALWK
jgi:hypothetical protein